MQVASQWPASQCCGLTLAFVAFNRIFTKNVPNCQCKDDSVQFMWLCMGEPWEFLTSTSFRTSHAAFLRIIVSSKKCSTSGQLLSFLNNKCYARVHIAEASPCSRYWMYPAKLTLINPHITDTVKLKIMFQIFFTSIIIFSCTEIYTFQVLFIIWFCGGQLSISLVCSIYCRETLEICGTSVLIFPEGSQNTH